MADTRNDDDSPVHRPRTPASTMPTVHFENIPPRYRQALEEMLKRLEASEQMSADAFAHGNAALDEAMATRRLVKQYARAAISSDERLWLAFAFMALGLLLSGAVQIALLAFFVNVAVFVGWFPPIPWSF